VNFTEWDGLVRILFNRKHKTLHGVMGTKSVLKMLEANLRTYYALEDRMAPDPFPDVKQILTEVLSMEEFKGKRAANMDIDDFLALLTAFNEKGLHFA